MSENVFEVTDASFDDDVLGADAPILLDLWAPWCAPCRALAPVLKKLAAEYAGRVRVAKIDVEKYPEVQTRFGVRGIPTMILFKAGAEASREVGTKTADQMRRWLAREGIEAPEQTSATPVPAGDAPRWGAFYGDVELRDFLMERLCKRANEGNVLAARTPFWIDGKGTISAALVGSVSPQVFSGMTGMPFSFAAVLEFVNNAWAAESISAVFKAIRPGVDLRAVALRMMVDWFGKAEHNWSGLLDDAALDALRLRWLSMCAQHLAGKEVASSEWTALQHSLGSLRSDHDPYRTVQDGVISLLECLSPPPEHDDAGSWVRGLCMSGIYTRYVLAEAAQGWTREDFALEGVRDRWFRAREQQQPGGSFTAEALKVARDEWYVESAGGQLRHDAFYKNSEVLFQPQQAALRAGLLALLADAPMVEQD